MGERKDMQVRSFGRKNIHTYEVTNFEEETVFYIRGKCSKGSSIRFSVETLKEDVEVQEIRFEACPLVKLETISL